MDATAVSDLALQPNSEWHGHVVAVSTCNGHPVPISTEGFEAKTDAQASSGLTLDVCSQVHKQSCFPGDSIHDYEDLHCETTMAAPQIDWSASTEKDIHCLS